MAATSVAEYPMDYERPLAGQMFEAFVRHAAGVAQLLDPRGDGHEVPFDSLPGRVQAHVRYCARAFIRMCNQQLLEEAEIRAILEYAITRFGPEFERLSSTQQHAAVECAIEAVHAYQRSLEGFYNPLSASDLASVRKIRTTPRVRFVEDV